MWQEEEEDGVRQCGLQGRSSRGGSGRNWFCRESRRRVDRGPRCQGRLGHGSVAEEADRAGQHLARVRPPPARAHRGEEGAWLRFEGLDRLRGPRGGFARALSRVQRQRHLQGHVQLAVQKLFWKVDAGVLPLDRRVLLEGGDEGLGPRAEQQPPQAWPLLHIRFHEEEGSPAGFRWNRRALSVAGDHEGGPDPAGKVRRVAGDLPQARPVQGGRPRPLAEGDQVRSRCSLLHGPRSSGRLGGSPKGLAAHSYQRLPRDGRQSRGHGGRGRL
mmetsp:Transcript_1237/g.3600  ORF Transcript_1237/g.3600 Transcript_1237/m.3600 type:complete len:272 (+) Transcript_1237:599-1414(+)